MCVKAIVTGAAGFVGSHLSELLLSEGHQVIGIDVFTENYSRELKENNLRHAISNNDFHFLRLDLAEENLNGLPAVDVVFHLAAQPGVRDSWGESFPTYLTRNLLSTQRLLERYKENPEVKFVVASSSSVYGNAKFLPIQEEASLNPISPYGVTKLSMERLLFAYHQTYKINVNMVRYFTLYGPRQRPDMAFNRFISCCINGEPLTIFGDGTQIRDFTFVGDAVRATVDSIRCCNGFEAYNIAAGKTIKLSDTIKIIEDISERPISVEFRSAQRGDAYATHADIRKAVNAFGYSPTTSLVDGLTQQFKWQAHLTQDHIR